MKLDTNRLDQFLTSVALEVARASEKHPPLNSAHEAYSVILEEVCEFWDEVKKKTKDRDRVNMQLELVQIAAMACRALIDLSL